MSLKQFHIVFIICSIICAAFFAYWSFAQYSRQESIFYLISGIIAAASVIGLCIYEISFIRKTKAIH